MDLKVSEILSTRIQEIQHEKKDINRPDFSFTLSKVGKEGLEARLST